MMQKDILAIVQDFSQWNGNSFTLAMLIANHVKDTAAAVADADGQTETADKIRAL